jgi:hypothetical protein
MNFPRHPSAAHERKTDLGSQVIALRETGRITVA